jgi:hypothetical protein
MLQIVVSHIHSNQRLHGSAPAYVPCTYTCHCTYAACIHASHFAQCAEGYIIRRSTAWRGRRRKRPGRLPIPEDGRTTLVRAATNELDGSERRTMVTQSVNPACGGSTSACSTAECKFSGCSCHGPRGKLPIKHDFGLLALAPQSTNIAPIRSAPCPRRHAGDPALQLFIKDRVAAAPITKDR